MSENEIGYMTLLYSLFGLLLFRVLYHRLDILVALSFVLSLLLFQAQISKVKIQFFVNILVGFFYKIVPIFLMPAAIIIKAFHNTSFDLKKIIKRILFDFSILASSLIIIIWSLEIFTNHHFIENILFHQKRGIHLESSYGSFLMMKNLLSIGRSAEIYCTYNCWNILGNKYVEFIAKTLGFFILSLFYGLIFFIFLHKKNHGKNLQFSEAQFLELTLVVILIILAFQRVLSPQFFIWLIPIAAIWLTKNRSVKFLVIFSFLFFASFFIFSIDYFSLVREIPIMVIMLFLRNCVLVIFTFWLMVKFLKNLNR
jgi:hypothetical protein